ncbi:MAG: TonB-dependent receptor [Chitinophagales bacterium]
MKFILVTYISLCSLFCFSQKTIKGKIIDNSNAQPLIGATILEENSTNGTTSDTSGNFSIELKNENSNILISYLGYQLKKVNTSNATDFIIKMDAEDITNDEVVISASRFQETIAKSPANIYKITSKEIQNTPSGDYYEGLKKIPNVDIVNNSFAMKIFNSRGFNTTSPFRVTQIIDGIDNMSPVLTFSPGTLFSVSDIDIDNIELISGPASALYGPNALQGVISIKTKDPFIREGLTLQLKGGSRKFVEGQARYAQAFGKKKKIALKIAGSYFTADDWRANDETLNNYRKIPYAPQRIGALSQSLATDMSLTADQRQAYTDFNNYTASNPNVNPGNITFTLPGYDEKYLAKNRAYGAKVSASLDYKITNTIKLSYLYKFNSGSAVYQGNNRAYMDNFRFNQHKLELSGKDFFVRTYVSQEDLANSYDLVLTGINLGIAGLPNVNKTFLNAYLDSVKILSNNYTTALTNAQVAQLKASSTAAAQSGWLQPGTEAFQAAFNKITTSGNRPTGSKYTSRSLIVHLEGQYNYTYKILDINAGASYRRIIPKTKGEIFSDTLMPNGKYKNLAYNEYGGFVQLTTRLLKNDLKLLASLRIDKSQNFKVQFSPRVGIVYNKSNHSIRLSWQTAFRSPTLNDQYFYLNTGGFILKGNLSGYNNLYTTNSLNAYNASPTKDSTLLKTFIAKPIKPENLNTIEIGYRLNELKGFSAEFTMYYNRYSNFIGSINVIEPKSGNVNDSSGLKDVKTRNYNSYRIWVNSTNKVNTLGLGISLSYTIKNITSYINYTYNKFFDDHKEDDLIPGFNTPPHKLNIGITANKVWKGLGFGANFHWQDKFYWESPFANGDVKQIHTLDLEVHYEIEKIMSTLRVGGSNIYNNKVKYAAGAAEIGAFVYGSWTFDMAFTGKYLKKKN